MTRKIKGILFDLGDTLIDFAHVSMSALFKQGAQLGYKYLQEIGKDLPGFRTFHYRQLWAIRWNYIKAHVTGREFNSMDVMSHFAEKYGYQLTDEENLELAWRFYTPLSKATILVPGAVETLETLTNQGLEIGLVSNTFLPKSVLDRHLDLVSLGDLIPTRIYSSDVIHRKPHPKIFELALKKIGLQAENTMFVGNSLKPDIAGPQRAGMITVLRDLTGRGKKSRIKPDHILTDITELPQIVAQYE
ncbi:MAG: HAD family hydrolase [Phycisphaerales bacterium]|jgi:putative hydrolase of the HAD superfamily|nr:HAD family hydrolase [Phycisphaerales bacterium]